MDGPYTITQPALLVLAKNREAFNDLLMKLSYEKAKQRNPQMPLEVNEEDAQKAGELIATLIELAIGFCCKG